MTPVRLRFDPIGVGCWANKNEFDSVPTREELRVRGEGRQERKQCGQWEGGCSQGCGSREAADAGLIQELVVLMRKGVWGHRWHDDCPLGGAGCWD